VAGAGGRGQRREREGAQALRGAQVLGQIRVIRVKRGAGFDGGAVRQHVGEAVV